jgi:hypothetical protein
MRRLAWIMLAALLLQGRPCLSHEHHAPHGGCLVEVGDEFAHIELTLDLESGTLTAYVLDGEAENSLRLRQESLRLRLEGGRLLTLRAVTDPLTGEKPGDCSEFRVISAALRKRRHFRGAIEGALIRGQRFKSLPFAFSMPLHDQP